MANGEIKRLTQISGARKRHSFAQDTKEDFRGYRKPALKPNAERTSCVIPKKKYVSQNIVVCIFRVKKLLDLELPSNTS